MSKEKKTKCECPLAGFCKRHNMVKGPHLHKLCQTREDYFQLWEEGFGPGQGSPQNTAAKEEEEIQPIVSENTAKKIAEETATEEEKKMPSLGKQAWGFTKALANHIKSGAAHASEELYKARLEVCDTCDKRSGDRCIECGCSLPAKAKWATSDCPIGKWPKEEDLQ